MPGSHHREPANAGPRPASDAVVVRSATADDLPALADIYNEAVAHSVATFDVEPQPPELFADRVASTRPGDHVVVAELGGRVVGMAYAATYRPRPAYDGSRETSIYLAPDGSGVTSQIRPDGDIVLDDAVTGRFHLPVCVVCGSDTLKPDVVFFGESVPKDTVGRCFDIVDGADSLLVLGSSLAVMSGYRFVRRAARNGIPVAIVTASASRGDPEATLRLHTPLGATLEHLCMNLNLT